MANTQHVTILGAGAIGCYTGALLAHGGSDVTLVGRPNILDPIRKNGLRVGGPNPIQVPGSALRFAERLSDVDTTDLIIVTIKAPGLDRAVADLTIKASDAPILSLMNGIEPARRFAREFPKRAVIPGLVAFNVVWTDSTELFRSSAGQIVVQDNHGMERLAETSSGIMRIVRDIAPIQYGKLILNLTNPINALSGMPLLKTVEQRPFRLIQSAAFTEALTAYRTNGIAYEKASKFSPDFMARMLKAPDLIFRNVFLPLQKLDPKSITSMAQDYAAHRETEIDVLNGEIVALAGKAAAPVNTALVRLIKDGPQKGWPTFSGPDLMRAVGLSS
ncbi:MAG: 2-dehydropantoate 2-reductase [Pseudomonadota bacterium]